MSAGACWYRFEPAVMEVHGLDPDNAKGRVVLVCRDHVNVAPVRTVAG